MNGSVGNELMKSTIKAVNCVGRAPKWKPLENLSTTTMIVVNPWELGRWVTKSMERSSQTLASIGIDCNKPALLRVMCLICWHTAHSRTKVLMSLIMLCHWKLDWRRCRVFLIPKWPPTGVAWYSWSKEGINGFWESNHIAPLKMIKSSEMENSGCASGWDWMASRCFWNFELAMRVAFSWVRNSGWGTERTKYWPEEGSSLRDSKLATMLEVPALYWIS